MSLVAASLPLDAMPNLQVLRPVWLLVLLVALPTLFFLHRHGLTTLARWQRTLSFVLRVLVVGLLALALTGPIHLQSTTRQMIVVAVDRSLSIDAAANEMAEKWVADAVQSTKQPPDTSFRFVEFDSTVTQTREQWMTGEPEQLRDQEPAKETPRQGTDIALAIRSAIASVPPSFVPKVVLVSDGNATTGDAVSAATANVPIYTVPLPTRSESEVQVVRVDAPAQVREGEPFYVEVVINANRATSGYVDLFRGDVKIGDNDNDNNKPIEIKEGENRFRFRQTITADRRVMFTATLRGFGSGDTLLDNNTASALIAAQGRPRVLMIESDLDQVDALRWALDEQAISLEVRPPEGVPRDLSELQGFECLVLSNVPATAMTMRQMDVIRTYVQDLGGGLVMLGGDQSFGLGGYYRTQLEEILPVRSNFEKEREKPTLAMVLVIDKSGSMGGEKIELAKDAARAAVELLSPRDSVGVIAFDGASYWVSDLRTASDKAYVIDQISTIEASGGTTMYPAMEDAYQALLASSAKLKHCIVLTDGISSPGDFEGIATEMASSKMTVSTVAMGQGAAQDLLEDIARLGNGRYYVCDDPQSVPQVFAKETMEASKSAINEVPFLAQSVRPTSVLADIDLELAPLLLGYVVTRPKPTSEFILATEAGDPLLAWWRFGLGMTVAFTSDAKARWASEWLQWPEFGKFWAQIIRHAMRKGDTRGMFVEIAQRDGVARLAVDATDDSGRFIDDAVPAITVVGPSLKTEKLTMIQTAPGRYEMQVPTPTSGAYQIDVAQDRNGTVMRQSRGLVVGYADELKLLPTNEKLLSQIAESSGGQHAASLESILAADGRTARLPIHLWPYLLMLALAMFIADVALRRVDLGTPTT